MKPHFFTSRMQFKAVALLSAWAASHSLSAAALQNTTRAVPANPETRAETTYPDVEITVKPLEFRQFEKVEITGSAILAKEAKQALPLQVIDRREIERSKASNLPELIQSLPIMSNFSELGAATGTLHGGPEAAAIHGNQGGTLVLLNGRRLPYYGSQTIMGERAVVDLNFLLLGAVERIEILTDGASSRYGSDAVAGVINVITKSDLLGVNVSVNSTLSDGGRGQGQGLSLSWGAGRLHRDGYSLRAHFSAQKTMALYAKDREVSSQGARSVQIDGKTWWKNHRTNKHSAPAQNYESGGVVFNEHHLRTGRCDTGWYELVPGECFANMQGEMTLYPETDKQILFVQGDRQLANRWVLFAEGLVGRQSQTMIPDGLIEELGVFNADKTRKYLLHTVPLGLLTQRYSNSMHNLTAGLRGEQLGWDFVTSLSSGQHRVVRAYTSGLGRNDLATLVLPPEVITQQPSEYSAQTLADMLQYRRGHRNMDDGASHMDSAHLLASREWMDTVHGPVGVGVGLDWRRERVQYASPDTDRPSFNLHRYVWAAHSELTVPLGPSSELTGALRHDQYSDFGGVQTGKLGWKWKPQQAWLFRASAGTGFRAPTLAQMAPLTTTILAHLDPVSGDWITRAQTGNPNLKPERSVQNTLGLRYEPNARWSYGVDLWQIDIKDTFGTLTGAQILQTPQLRAKYLVAGQIQQINKNLGRSIKRGLDYDVHWRQPTEFGRLRTNFKGVYMLKSATQDAAAGSYVSNIAQSADPKLTTARQQFSFTSMLERPEWTGGLVVHYKTGYSETTTLEATDGAKRLYTARIPSHWTLDVMSLWQIQPKLSLRAHLINATNRMPALRLANHDNVLLGVDTRYANYTGRHLQLKLNYKF